MRHLDRLFLGSVVAFAIGGGTLQAQIPTGNLLMWFKADAGVTVDGSGTNVSQWADQSGNGYLAVQPLTTPADRPDLVTNGINGQAALHFDGTFGGDRLTINNNTVNLTNGLSIFIVARNDVRKNYNGLFKIFPGSNPGIIDSDLRLYWQAGTTDSGSGNLYYQTDIDAYPTTYGEIGSINQPPPVGSPYLYDVLAVSSGATQRVNGVTAGVPDGNIFVPTNANFAVIGYGFSQYALDGMFAELIVYDAALSSSQRDNVWAYLEGKYSLGLPEPSTMTLLGLGGMVLLWRRRKAALE